MGPNSRNISGVAVCSGVCGNHNGAVARHCARYRWQNAAASEIAYVTMGMAVAPMPGPGIGGYFDT